MNASSIIIGFNIYIFDSISRKLEDHHLTEISCEFVRESVEIGREVLEGISL